LHFGLGLALDEQPTVKKLNTTKQQNTGLLIPLAAVFENDGSPSVAPPPGWGCDSLSVGTGAGALINEMSAKLSISGGMATYVA
jgi:hypothetical protein